MLIVALVGALGCARESDDSTDMPPPQAQVIVGVDSDLHAPSSRAVKVLRERLPRLKIVTRSGSSGQLAAEIRSGRPMDIVLLSDLRRMAQLAVEGLVDPTSIRPLAGNGLVFVLRAASELHPKGLEDLLDPALGQLALGDPESDPSGARAAGLLAEAGLWDTLSTDVRVTDDGTHALGLLLTGEVDGAFVRLTDALASGEEVRIALTFPLEPHVHEVALLRQPAGAGRFPASVQVVYELLAGEEFQAILEELGYVRE